MLGLDGHLTLASDLGTVYDFANANLASPCPADPHPPTPRVSLTLLLVFDQEISRIESFRKKF